MSGVGGPSLGRRVALVIGNSRYKHVGRLRNPNNDARAVAQALEKIGFEVTRRRDLQRLQLEKELGDFATRAADVDIAIFYFAGHGIEMDAENYLIPVEAKLTTATPFKFQTVPLRNAIDAASGARRLSLIIVDACRDNLFRTRLIEENGARSIGIGLARVDPGKNNLVAYAAKHGMVAYDGPGNNSPYAKSLVKFISKPGLEIRFLLGHVRDQVLEETDNKQEPYIYGSLGSQKIFLNPRPPKKAPEPEQPRIEPEPQPSGQTTEAPAKPASGTPSPTPQEETLIVGTPPAVAAPLPDAPDTDEVTPTPSIWVPFPPIFGAGPKDPQKQVDPLDEIQKVREEIENFRIDTKTRFNFSRINRLIIVTSKRRLRLILKKMTKNSYKYEFLVYTISYISLVAIVAASQRIEYPSSTTKELPLPPATEQTAPATPVPNKDDRRTTRNGDEPTQDDRPKALASLTSKDVNWTRQNEGGSDWFVEGRVSVKEMPLEFRLRLKRDPIYAYRSVEKSILEIIIDRGILEFEVKSIFLVNHDRDMQMVSIIGGAMRSTDGSLIPPLKFKSMMLDAKTIVIAINEESKQERLIAFPINIDGQKLISEYFGSEVEQFEDILTKEILLAQAKLKPTETEEIANALEEKEFEQKIVLREGTATHRGTVVWVAEPVDSSSPHLVIRGRVEVRRPKHDLKMVLTVRRSGNSNGFDHSIDLLFETEEEPTGFEIAEVRSISTTKNELEKGRPFVGPITRIKDADDRFHMNLSPTAQEGLENLQALMEGEWLNIDLLYMTKKHGSLWIEKGGKTREVFGSAYLSWN